MGFKEVRVIITGGEVKIKAEGVAGQGTAGFTEDLAKGLGKIEERHVGMDHVGQVNTQQNQVGH